MRLKKVKDSNSSLNNGAKYAMSFACLNCRVSFMRHFDELPKDYPRYGTCQICGGVTHNLGRHFKPPKKSNVSKWKVIRYLVENGFYFQKIRPIKNSYLSVSYPTALSSARQFVKKYRQHALK